jgi:hypothetical protein
MKRTLWIEGTCHRCKTKTEVTNKNCKWTCEACLQILEKKPRKYCERCKIDITSLNANAKFCEDCRVIHKVDVRIEYYSKKKRKTCQQ